MVELRKNHIEMFEVGNAALVAGAAMLSTLAKSTAILQVFPPFAHGMEQVVLTPLRPADALPARETFSWLSTQTYSERALTQAMMAVSFRGFAAADE